jgi:hypothetical protein
MNLNLVLISALIAEGAIFFETAFSLEEPDKLLIFDRRIPGSNEPEEAVGSIVADSVLEAYTCTFGDETMHFTDDLGAVLWMVGKEMQ